MKRLLPFLFLTLCFSGLSFGQTGEAALAEEYFQDGEFESAKELFNKLYKKDPDNTQFISRLAECYTQLEQFDEGIKFLDKVLKRKPSAHTFGFVKADMLRNSGQLESADALENDIISNQLRTEADFKAAGTWLYSAEKFGLALKSYEQGRKTVKGPGRYPFSTELAAVQAMLGNFSASTQEFLNRYYDNPSYLNTVSVQILNLVSPGSKEDIEKTLLAAVNKRSNDRGLRQILFEYYVLTEEFYEAFVQVKSIDKVFGRDGKMVYDFAITMRNNRKYRISNKALDYVIDNRAGSSYGSMAFEAKTINNELQAFETIPLDTNAIRSAVNSYDDLLKNLGRQPRYFKSMYRKANLQAFYLNDLSGALKELSILITLSLDAQSRSKANLLIGDILLMQKEYNKAKLKYNEVAEAFAEGQIGALAKYKQGRLSYFKGDFEYAKARLKSIKDNTSNDISNDAIKLFLLIQDNVGLDTSTVPLEMFGQAQLLVFQRDFDQAMPILDSILYNFPNHSLTDEILWEKANVYLTKGDVNKALGFMDRILDGYPEDILGDDALFTKARIHDYTLKDKDKAMELYISFLRQYPGSLFIVEVRKRIRDLRSRKL